MEENLLPKGFKSSGIRAGIKESGNKDLGLIFCDKEALAGAIFTKNKFPAAPVQYSRSLTPNNKFRALIVSAGNANAATGTEGLTRNKKMAESLAAALEINSNQVLTSSTGIIGHQLPVNLIKGSIKELIDSLSDNNRDFSRAIMTTDTVPKVVSASFSWEGKSYKIAGISKGVGMIQPNMGTMLSYLLTDAPLAFDSVQEITQSVADSSFNQITVDGDTSTNDSFFLISSNQVTSINSDYRKELEQQLKSVAIELAQKIASDGEGAQHLIELQIKNAQTKEIADKILQSVLNSSLVKTAIHGKDPNWGRIVMATGNALALADDSYQENPAISIMIQSVPVFIKGVPADFDFDQLSAKMADHKVIIEIDCHNGSFTTTGWGCDLTAEYVSINADYST